MAKSDVLTKEEAKSILGDIFGIPLCEDEKGNLMVASERVLADGSKKSLSADQKKLFNSFLDASKTPTGSKIFRKLDHDQPISLVVDEKYNEGKKDHQKSDGYASSDLIAFTPEGLKGNESRCVEIAVHEATHIVQHQQGDTSEYSTAQDSTVIRKLSEAEAWVTGKTASEEFFKMDSSKTLWGIVKYTVRKLDQKLVQFDSKLRYAVRHPIKAFSERKKNKKLSQKMRELKSVYENKSWGDFYNNSCQRSNRYIRSESLVDECRSADEVLKSYQERLGLTHGEMAHLVDPKNDPYYPKDVPLKTEKQEKLPDGMTKKTIYEQNKPVFEETRDGETGKLVSTKVYMQDEKGSLLYRFDENGKKTEEVKEYTEHESSLVRETTTFDSNGQECVLTTEYNQDNDVSKRVRQRQRWEDGSWGDQIETDYRSNFLGKTHTKVSYVHSFEKGMLRTIESSYENNPLGVVFQKNFLKSDSNGEYNIVESSYDGKRADGLVKTTVVKKDGNVESRRKDYEGREDGLTTEIIENSEQGKVVKQEFCDKEGNISVRQFLNGKEMTVVADQDKGLSVPPPIISGKQVADKAQSSFSENVSANLSSEQVVSPPKRPSSEQVVSLLSSQQAESSKQTNAPTLVVGRQSSGSR